MSKFSKLQKRIESGINTNWRFEDTQYLVEKYGYKLDRISGSHHIYIHSKTKDMINIQNVKGQAKPYQMKQIIKKLS